MAHNNLKFIPLKIAILTISDTRNLEQDKSGQILSDRLIESGHILAERRLVPDDIFEIRAQIDLWLAKSDCNIILTTGGTGLAPRDVTIEAISPFFSKKIDGFSTIFHLISFQKIGTATMQSRTCAGIIGKKLVFCLPGSPGACRDGWDEILRYQLDSRHRPCNFVEIIAQDLF